MSRDLELEANKVSGLKRQVAELKNRIRIARAELRAAIKAGNYMEAVNDAEMVLDVRRPLHDRSRR